MSAFCFLFSKKQIVASTIAIAVLSMMIINNTSMLDSYLIFFNSLEFSNDLIWDIAVLFNNKSLWDCSMFWWINNALILSKFDNTTNCSIVAVSLMFPISFGFASRQSFAVRPNKATFNKSASLA